MVPDSPAEECCAIRAGIRPAPAGLSCAAVLDSGSNAYFNTTLSGVLVSGYCKPGYARSATAPARTCSVVGVWTAVTGSCDRTTTAATAKRCGTRMDPMDAHGVPHARLSVLLLSYSTELFCPNGNVDFNAQWPSDVPAGTYVDGAFCPPGWTGSIGRQCQLNGQWAASATGGCVRTYLARLRAMAGLRRPSGRACRRRLLTCRWTLASPPHDLHRAEVFCAPKHSGELDGFAAWPLTAASSQPVNVTVTACDEKYIGAPVRSCNPDGTWGAVFNPCSRTQPA